MTELINAIRDMGPKERALLKKEIESLEPKLADFVKATIVDGEDETTVSGIVTRRGSKYMIQTNLEGENGFETKSIEAENLEVISAEDFELPTVESDEPTIFSKASYVENGRKYYGFIFDSFKREDVSFYKVKTNDGEITLKGEEVTVEDEIKEAEVVDQKEAFIHDLKTNSFSEAMKKHAF